MGYLDEELHDVVDREPDWNTIDKIVVTLARPTSTTLTLKEAATQ